MKCTANIVRQNAEKRLLDWVFATNSKGMNNSIQDPSKRLDKKTKAIKGLSEVANENKNNQLLFYGFSLFAC